MMKTLCVVLCMFLCVVGCRLWHSAPMTAEFDLAGTWEMRMGSQGYKHLITVDRTGDDHYRLSSTRSLVLDGVYKIKGPNVVAVRAGGNLAEVVWHIEDAEHLVLSRARSATEAKNHNDYPGTHLVKLSRDEVQKHKPLTRHELLDCARRHVLANEECRNVMAQMTHENHPIETNATPDGLAVRFVRNDLTADGSMYEIEVRMNYDGTLVDIRSERYPLSSAICRASDIHATLEPPTTREGLFTIHITNVSSNTIRFLDIAEGAALGGDLYQIIVVKDGNAYESGDVCAASGPAIPSAVSLNPGRTYDRAILVGGYIRQLPKPPFTISVKYRLTERFKSAWLGMHANLETEVVKKLHAHLNLDLVFQTDEVIIGKSPEIVAP